MPHLTDTEGRLVLKSLRTAVAQLKPVLSVVSDAEREIVLKVVGKLSESAGRLVALGFAQDSLESPTPRRSDGEGFQDPRDASRRTVLATCLSDLEAAALQIRSWLEAKGDR